MKSLTIPFLFLFTTSKNYTSTFKIRSRLSQFFKHVHPDQLSQAPTKVKQQNLRSLTNFNSYIDSISQSKSIEAKLLKFYIAEKTNLKSKKFFSFTVELPEIKAHSEELDEQKAKKLVDNIVDVLNKKFVESKNFRTKHGKLTQDKIQKIDSIKVQDSQTQSQRFNRMSSKINPFSKKQSMTETQQQFLKSALNTKYMQAQKQSLSTKLKKTITFANTSTNKPLYWSRIASEQAGLYKDYQKIMDELIDPRLIYFDETLTTIEIEQFKKRLLPGSMNRQSYKNSKIIVQVCAKMQSFQPPICFYITKKYSSTQIPGFLSIPYNFNAKQLATYFQKQINTVLEQQQKYQQFYDYYHDLKAQLQTQNNLYVDQVQFRNNMEIWERVLMLKRLQRYRMERKGGAAVVVFDKEKYAVFAHKYCRRSSDNTNTDNNNNNGNNGNDNDKINTKNSTNTSTNNDQVSVAVHQGKIVCRVDFADEDMQKVVEYLNRQQKSKSG